MARTPTIDRTTSGISFVDILFALAVGEVLAPLVPWAANHAKHSLPAPIVWNLAVALVLILTSFIGYHNSQNRPLFTVRFVNVSLCKFAARHPDGDRLLPVRVLRGRVPRPDPDAPASRRARLRPLPVVGHRQLVREEAIDLPNRVDEGRR